MIASQNTVSTSSPLPRSVRRALEAMHGNAGHGWNVTELAAVAGVSGRTLQRQFLAFVGKAPRTVLREINFDRARRELLQGSAGAKVVDVALRCGFPHPGRFSVEYRRRYGETPSQTLKRQEVFAAALASMPSVFVPPRDRPTVAFGPIEAAAEHLEIAGAVADDLATALTRAGISVASLPRSARYHLVGAIRGDGAQMRLIFTPDRQRNRPPALGTPCRRRATCRRFRRGTPRHADCRGASAVLALRRNRARLAQARQ